MCREVGIEETFRRLKSGDGGDTPPVMKAIQELLTSRSAADVENTIRRNAHLLLTDEADQIFEQNIRNAPPDAPSEFVSGLENARQLLQLCRQHGIDRAFEMLNQGSAPPSQPSPGYGTPPSAPSYGTPPAQPSPGYGAPPSQPSPGYGAPPSQPTPGYGAPPPGAGSSAIPGDFENRVVAGLRGSPREKMDLFAYLESLSASDPGMQALIDSAKRAAFGDVANAASGLSGEYATVWARIVQRVQGGG
jgi:hypothetical protein